MRRILLIFTLLAIIFSSCSETTTKTSPIKSNSSNGNKSRTTGWLLNDMENFSFKDPQYIEQRIGPGLSFVEGGTFTMGRIDEDVMRDWDNIPRRVTIASFYMDETEVTNFDYRQMLAWLKSVYKDKRDPNDSQNRTKYKQMLPDTLVWREELAYNEPWVHNYMRHPAYNQYPVVGVSWEQAKFYCKWRTDRVNEYLLYEAGKIPLDTTLFKANDYNSIAEADKYVFTTEKYLSGQYAPDTLEPEDRVRWEDGILLPNYRLPTEAEWEYAALGLIGEADGELLTERRMFPWEGEYIRDSEGNSKGLIKANFVRGRGDYMGMAGALNDRAAITAQVKTYDANDYGLYDMAGNVNEWVADVYRPYSPFDVEEFQPFRGNEITMNNGYDSFGLPKDSLVADYRNYMDGDSITAYPDKPSQPGKSGSVTTSSMYAEIMTNFNSPITDEVRVYKGGGWRDRVYWLNPGARRFLPQTESRADLGFRCAMTHLGPPTTY